MRGDMPVLDTELSGLTLPHVAAAVMLSGQGRNIRRTDTRGYVTMPMLLAMSGLRGRGEKADAAVRRIERVYRERQAIGSQTSIQIGPGDIDADVDLGIKRDPTASHSRVQDGGDDPVMARLMEIHGVTRLARTEGGLDARWRMPGRSANPYVNYRHLPEDFPPFILRPRTKSVASHVEIQFGSGVTYVNTGGLTELHLETALPEVIGDSFAGKPVEQVFEHPAFVGLVFDENWQNHGLPGVHAVKIMGN